MKDETLSFYETAVRKAVEELLASLDQALDLTELARGAALSPFHFHRLFRGLTGETPLAMHRRLRLERAAVQLAEREDSVTSIAFDAGYNTHESFTRAFHGHYGIPPSEYRQRAKAGGSSCAGPHPFRLASANAIHFEVTDSNSQARRSGFIELATIERGVSMDVSIERMPSFRLGAVRHVGPYARISEAFQRMDAIARRAGLLSHPQAAMIAVYYDDPEVTPAEQLRADAAIAVPEDIELPDGLTEVRLPAGQYAKTVHAGPYESLGDTWVRLMGQWLPKSGYRVADGGLSYELYRNTPMTAAPEELRTELYLPLSAER